MKLCVKQAEGQRRGFAAYAPQSPAYACLVQHLAICTRHWEMRHVAQLQEGRLQEGDVFCHSTPRLL